MKETIELYVGENVLAYYRLMKSRGRMVKEKFVPVIDGAFRFAMTTNLGWLDYVSVSIQSHVDCVATLPKAGT